MLQQDDIVDHSTENVVGHSRSQQGIIVGCSKEAL